MDCGKQLDALRRALNELIEDGLGGMGLVAPGSVAGCFCFVLAYSKKFFHTCSTFQPLENGPFFFGGNGIVINIPTPATVLGKSFHMSAS